ncbi:MAG: hypothetical protein Q4C89_00900 [Deinococcus sp.]|uniref:hypothetical protein n=1 Tax=Deinococcus sp. TaxID=47478 RepID=UPI0026DC3FDD|nr:hypothetical protein [Deinococcus sp.]MDO4244567.1 hypothetical protein [Deinococcus sp.]
MSSSIETARKRATDGVKRAAASGHIFQHALTFRLGGSEWKGRFSVKDPQKLKPDEVSKLRVFADTRGLLYTDLRQVKPYPDDVPPFPGATTPFDDGTLEILEWSQPSGYVGHYDAAGEWVGQRTGTAVLRRP